MHALFVTFLSYLDSVSTGGRASSRGVDSETGLHHSGYYESERNRIRPHFGKTAAKRDATKTA